MAIYKINNLEDLKKLASSLFKKLKAGDVVALSGELGAGKTTLVQMLAKEFGIKETVQSPSFNIFKIIEICKFSNNLYVCNRFLNFINVVKFSPINISKGKKAWMRSNLLSG